MIERNLYRKIAPHLESPEAIILTGMRRTGKTSLLRFIHDQIPSRNKLFLDLENPLHQKRFEEIDFDRVKTNLEFLGLDSKKKAYVFLDEIQLVPKLPQIAKYLIDHYGIKFFMTGSASFYLKSLFSESLVGRKFLFELFPLTFDEFLRFRGGTLAIPNNPAGLTQAMIRQLSTLYEDYAMFGGFPGVVLKENIEEKKLALDDVFTSYYQLEVLRLGDFRKNTVIRDLMLLLMERVGSKLDIQKLASEIGISRPTLTDYIGFLEGTYFISLVRPFTKNRDSEIRKMPKIYFCDTGIIGHLARLDSGRIFEESVFQNLRPQGEVSYYERKSGGEIDFILDKQTAIEVKVTPNPSDLIRLKKLSADIGIKEFKIVGKNLPVALTGSKQAVFAFLI